MAAATISPTATRPTPETSFNLLIAGKRFDNVRSDDAQTSAAFQLALETARTKYGHALCTCRKRPLKLQVRLREGKFHLAVWPQEGQLHDITCAFFRDDEPLTGVAEVAAAVSDNPNGTREVDMAIGFSRIKQPDLRKAAAPAMRKSAATADKARQATFKALCHLLWTEANLTRWHPKWSRDWGRARFELLRAASALTVQGVPLNTRLFVPRPYRSTIQEQLNLEFVSFVERLSKPVGDTVPSGLVIAPVRAIKQLPVQPNPLAFDRPAGARDAQQEPQGNWSMHLRHMRYPVGMTNTTYEFLTSNTSAMRRAQLNEVAREASSPPPTDWVHIRQPEVIAFLQVEANSRGGLWARAAWLMSVHPTSFIPANNSDEVLMVEALMDNEYAFDRLLSCEQPSRRIMSDWLLRHVADPHGHVVPRAALEIRANGASPAYNLQRTELASKLAGEGIPTWTWTPRGKLVEHVLPPLPPKDGLSPAKTTAVLHQIRHDPTVQYVYGHVVLPSSKQVTIQTSQPKQEISHASV